MMKLEAQRPFTIQGAYVLATEEEKEEEEEEKEEDGEEEYE